MRSSYKNNDLNYGDIITAAIFNRNPKNIVEFGILDGFSLKIFADTFPNANIIAYDIFQEFNGNSSNLTIYDTFKENRNVKIEYGDFYKKYEEFLDKSIDILHIDIANNGDVYKFAIEKYLSKLRHDGILILEGGSRKRDQVDWMIKYDKPLIEGYLVDLRKKLNLRVMTIGECPSITLISYNNELEIRELCEGDFEKGFFELVNYFTRNYNPRSKKNAMENINLFNNDFIKTLVVEYKNEIIATGKIFLETKIHNNMRKVGHIEDLIILDEYRNRGVGTYLLEKLLEIAKKNNCYKTILECNPDLVFFYEKFGFNKKGVEMSLYH